MRTNSLYSSQPRHEMMMVMSRASQDDANTVNTHKHRHNSCVFILYHTCTEHATCKITVAAPWERAAAEKWRTK